MSSVNGSRKKNDLDLINDTADRTRNEEEDEKD
jgi:hypothetical protein